MTKMAANGLNGYPIYDQNGWKTIPFGAAHTYIAHIKEYPPGGFDSGTSQIYKKITNQNKRKCWRPLRDWCFLINSEQIFCINDHIWYLINSVEYQSVVLSLTASGALGKLWAKQNIILSNSKFINLFYLTIRLWARDFYRMIVPGAQPESTILHLEIESELA